jgi:hypothetical protein
LIVGQFFENYKSKPKNLGFFLHGKCNALIFTNASGNPCSWLSRQHGLTFWLFCLPQRLPLPQFWFNLEKHFVVNLRRLLKKALFGNGGLKPILRLLILQLQRQRCGRLVRFSKWKKIFLFSKRIRLLLAL